MMTYKRIMVLLVKWALMPEDKRPPEWRAYTRRLASRAARPRRCLPNGRSMPYHETAHDTPDNHIHPRHLREVRP